MKKAGFLLMILALAFSSSAHSQSRQTEEYQNGLRKAQSTSTVYIQLIAYEELNSPEAKIVAVIGKDNQFYVKDKSDFEIYDVLEAEVREFTLMPDALNYLGERGFVIETYSANTIGDRIRHTYLLSRSTVY